MAGQQVEKIGALARDARGHDSQFVSVRAGEVGRMAVPENAWVLVAKAERRNHILLQAPAANGSNIIIAFANDATVSNDPTSDLCGIDLIPGAALPLAMTQNVPIYARVVKSGSAGRIAFAETV